MIRLPKNITKEKRDKNIHINHHLKAVLDSLPRSIVRDYVITHRGNPVNGMNGLRGQFPTACKKAGIAYDIKVRQGIIFHYIRRTVKTNMVQAGVDKFYWDTILDHSLQGMDRHYVVLTDETLTEAIEKYTQWLDNQLNFAIFDQTVDHG